jgi:hypothetical protein
MLTPAREARRVTWGLRAGSPTVWVNGRSVINLFTNLPRSSNRGPEPRDGCFVDRALSAKSPAQAARFWRLANAQVMKDAAAVPIEIQKWTVFHSAKVQGCIFAFLSLNCDVTQVWLKK